MPVSYSRTCLLQDQRKRIDTCVVKLFLIHKTKPFRKIKCDLYLTFAISHPLFP